MQATNTFTKGLNTDADVSSLSKDSYIHAENFRLSPVDGQGTLENIRGNKLVATLPTGYKVIGQGRINEDIYLFTTNNTNSVIYQVNPDTFVLTSIYSDSSFTEKLGFNTSYKIKCVGRYETESIQKLYWVDGLNPLRTINVKKDNSSTSPDQLNSSTYVDVTKTIDVTGIINGSLPVGAYQYSYYYISKAGKQTRFINSTNYVYVTQDIKGLSSSVSTSVFRGDDKGTVTTCGISLTINLDTDYSKIGVIRIARVSLDDAPKITLIYESDVIGTSLNILDQGSTELGSFTEDQYKALTDTIVVPSEIETKNNYLFIGNIKLSTFDVTGYDTRAFRFYSASHATKPRKSILNSVLVNPISGTDTNKIEIDGTTLTNMSTIPTLHNCINGYNYDQSTALTPTSNYSITSDDYAMVYQANGTNLGGEGPNIKYGFILDETIESLPSLDIFSSTVGASYPLSATQLKITNGTYTVTAGGNTDYANSDFSINDTNNYIVKDKFRGLRRDEVYRIFIEFFDKYGNTSPSKWIGDVRTPTLAQASLTNLSYANTLRLKVTIKNTTSLIAKGVTAYRISYCERTEANKTILTSGLLAFCEPRYYLTGINPNEYAVIDDYRIGNLETTYSHDLGYTTTHKFKYGFMLTPEVYNGKKIEYTAADYVEVIGTAAPYYHNVAYNYNIKAELTKITQLNRTSGYDKSQANATYSTITRANYNIVLRGYNGMYTTYKKVVPLTATSIMSPDETKVVLPSDNKNIVNRCIGDDFKHTMTYSVPSGAVTSAELNRFNALSCTKLVVSGDFYSSIRNNLSVNGTGTSWVYFLLANYKRKNYSIYGGYTYSDRLMNTTIPLSSQTSISTNSVLSNTGDTFIGMCDYLVNYQDPTTISFTGVASTALQNIVRFPVESDLNLRYTNGDSWLKTDVTGTAKVLLNEVPTTYYSGTDVLYTQDKPYFQLNTVYNQHDNTRSNTSDISDFLSDTYFKNKVKASQGKVNGESIDSWLDFKTNDELDVNGNYGKITNLINYGNTLYFFQERAFGQLSVEAQQLISTGDTTSLVLGTGGPISRYDYISTVIGSSNRFGIATAPTGLYWLDDVNKGIVKFNNSVEYIGNSSIRKILNNTSYYTRGITNTYISGYDNINKEVIFNVTSPIKTVTDEYIQHGYDATLGNFMILGTTALNASSEALVLFDSLSTGDRIAIYPSDNASSLTTPALYPTQLASYVVGKVTNKYNSIYITSYGGTYTYVITFDVLNEYSSSSRAYGLIGRPSKLIYSEIYGTFVGYSFGYPSVYITMPDNRVVTTEDGNTLYLEGRGNTNTYYGVTKPSKVSFIVNQDYSTTKTFDTIEFQSTSKTKDPVTSVGSTGWGHIGSDDVFFSVNTADTFNKIKVSNQYQTSGIVDITMNSNIIRKERSFILGIPRNKLATLSDQNIQNFGYLNTTRLYQERMRDKYIKVDLTYTNTTGNLFKVPYVTTNYRVSKR